MSSLPILYIVIPCYNEQDVLPITAPIFRNELKALVNNNKVSNQSKILFVNDGSKDNTWEIISDLAQKDEIFCGVSQSRNRGHQNAVWAGMMEAKKFCDIVITIDCDGQDDIEAMKKMVNAYLNGSDIVYGVREQRKTDTFFKRFTAQTFYKLLSGLGVEAIYNHADYRLISKRALIALSEFKEVNLFLRGMVPLVGFPHSIVYYNRNERIAGKSHYPFKKMLALAIDGITSLSVKPIRIITSLGFIVSTLSIIGVMWTLLQYILGNTVSGWAPLMCIVCMLSGVQLLCLGVVGEYIGKIYLEVKKRPRYIISERTHNFDTKD